MKKTHLALLAFGLLFLGSCKQIRQMANLRKCQFRIQSVTDTRLAGIDIQAIRSFKDLRLGDAAKATTAFITGNLPLQFNLNLQVRNPNTERAAMNRFDWVAMIDQTEILEGTSLERIEVESNGGLAVIPLLIQVNIKEILSKLGRNKDQIMDYGFALTDSQKRPTRVAIKLRPSIQVGQRAIMYPGWFTVKREFTSGS
ncbi:MAG: hypothetical protein AAGN35_27405 [Bacteroidota bacterium]